MMKSNSAEAGKRIHCPDGDGIVLKILNPDVVLIQLERGVTESKPLVARFDLSECSPLETHTPPQPKEISEEVLNTPVIGLTKEEVEAGKAA